MKAIIENINESTYPAAILPVLQAVSAAWTRAELETLMKKAITDPQYALKAFDLEYTETRFIVRDYYSKALVMWASYDRDYPNGPNTEMS